MEQNNQNGPENQEVLPPAHILPHNQLAEETAVAAGGQEDLTSKSVLATKSFDEAANTCREKVAKMSQECRQANRKYRDFYFDLALDHDSKFCLRGLTTKGSEFNPGGFARVEDIFENPVFFKDGAKPGDIKQGCTGDCWFLAACTTITNLPGLLEKICVARDEEIGIYGFVFMRDGEWISTIIDDQLYLSKQQYDDMTDVATRRHFLGREAEYNRLYVEGSRALYFAKCDDPNETWLPLLEKAYAKAHGDYGAIEGGYTGEAVEDLTGGVTSEVWTNDILSREKFWKDELMQVNKEFLFGAWIPKMVSVENESRTNIIKGHAYSVLRAVEAKGERLVLLRNPWGCHEYNGPWSDGSKEWTAEWLELLGHRFGDDGQFWMTYRDFLRKFRLLDRTRLFDRRWTVTSSRWLRVPVEYTGAYSPLRFRINVTQKGPVIIVLSQLDDRFFKGLEGQYNFNLHFRVHKEGEQDYIRRATANGYMSRSVSVELELEPGKYVVIFKVDADFNKDYKKAEDVFKADKKTNRKKFLQVAMSYDLAHAKAVEFATEEKAREASAKKEEETKAAEEKNAEKYKESKDKSDAPKRTDEEKKKEEELRKTEEELKKKEIPNVDQDTGLRILPEHVSAVEYKNTEDPWDPKVCLGLRVYSQDENVTVDVIATELEKADKADIDDNSRDASATQGEGKSAENLEVSDANSEEELSDADSGIGGETVVGDPPQQP